MHFTEAARPNHPSEEGIRPSKQRTDLPGGKVLSIYCQAGFLYPYMAITGAIFFSHPGHLSRMQWGQVHLVELV